MQDKSYIPFTKEMKKDYTILVPNMLPVHFSLILSVLQTYGFKTELLKDDGAEIAETGLKYTHNDACYPAVLVIGQFIHALQSGRYDSHKTALIMFQTGGGCRASNYISLIRKALCRAGMEYVPIISFSLAGIERHPGFKLSLPMLRAMIYGVLYGDLLMSLSNSVKPFEKEKGSAQMIVDSWTARLGREMGSGSRIRYSDIRKNYAKIIGDFEKIEVEKRSAVRVGIVGEIFVKYSPLANNHLEEFLIGEGAQTVVPGLFDFCMYALYNVLMEYKLYGRKAYLYPVCKFIYKKLCGKKNDISSLLQESSFEPWTPFEKIVDMSDGYIGHGTKMGEGWLLTAEMLELANSGCKNIVCTQPFGCLPNHICGKGMMKLIKEKNSDVNIVAIDYDPGASRVNQENRLKLMLFNAHRNEKSDAGKKAHERQKNEVYA